MTQSAAATGSLAPSVTYGLAFGHDPTIAGSSSSSSSSSSASSGSGGSSTLAGQLGRVKVGDTVTKGQVLAVADSASATPALSRPVQPGDRQARLASDEGGLTAVDKAMARLSITQAEQQLSNARVERIRDPAAEQR